MVLVRDSYACFLRHSSELEAKIGDGLGSTRVSGERVSLTVLSGVPSWRRWLSIFVLYFTIVDVVSSK